MNHLEKAISHLKSDHHVEKSQSSVELETVGVSFLEQSVIKSIEMACHLALISLNFFANSIKQIKKCLNLFIEIILSRENILESAFFFCKVRKFGGAQYYGPCDEL